MTPEKLQAIIEAAIMVSDRPLTIAVILNLFEEDERPSNADIKSAINAIKERYTNSGIELQEVASGYRIQAKAELSPWLAKLWTERAPRYSRAFLETLSIIAYKQPITRAEIEEIRGVTVSSNIMKTLQERDWVRVLGYKDVPGKPAILGTSKAFLDYFNLKSLSELPTLAEFKDMELPVDELQVELAIQESDIGPNDSEVIPGEREALVAEENLGEEETDSPATENIAAMDAQQIEDIRLKEELEDAGSEQEFATA